MKTFIKLVSVIGCILVTAYGTPVKNVNGNLKFDIHEEWSLIPDANGQLRMLHSSEIKTSEPENFFDPELDIKFLLFTRSNPLQPVTFTFDQADEVLHSYFNPSRLTKFTIHGWNAGITSGVNLAVTKEYLKAGDYNVFVIDWSKGANTVNYIDARNRVRDVGRTIADFINSLVKLDSLHPSKVTIIGHSLGGHAAGMAAKSVNSGRVFSVIGLDPAGPLFYLDSPHDRLDIEDADYVQVIHTTGNLGFHLPIGHSDFYPNGGRAQPGCGIDLIGTCAHSRAHQYYAEAITSNIGFYAKQCASMEEMEKAQCTGKTAIMNGTPAYGIFYLKTRDSSPFALGEL